MATDEKDIGGVPADIWLAVPSTNTDISTPEAISRRHASSDSTASTSDWRSHLDLIDVHLGPGPNAEKLADAWARPKGLTRLRDAAKPTHFTLARRDPKKPRTKNLHTRNPAGPARRGGTSAGLRASRSPRQGKAVHPRSSCLSRRTGRSARCRRSGNCRRVRRGSFREEDLDDRLEKRQPNYRPLLDAIRDTNRSRAACRTPLTF